MECALAVLGFAAFLCHDFQSVGGLKWRGFRFGFAAGAALWAAAFGWLIAVCARFTVPARLIPWSAAALVSLAAELYALFFALPFEKRICGPTGRGAFAGTGCTACAVIRGSGRSRRFAGVSRWRCPAGGCWWARRC